MRMKYVILRDTPSEKLALPRPLPARVSPSVSPEVEVGDLEPRRAASLVRRKDIRAVAPVIPMKLIAPVGSDTDAVPVADGMTWGVQAVAADTSPFTGESIVVAVLDTGIDTSHPAFAGVDIVRKNFTTDSDDDEDGHGTHCAGTILGRNVAGTRIGVAPGISKALIGKVIGKGGGGSDQIMQAIEWAVNGGANVVSMSLGFDFPRHVKELETDGLPTELAISMALEGYRANILLFEALASFIAAQNAFMQATLLVAAAGNESRREEDPDFEIAVSPPAVANGFVSVAAVAKTPQGFAVAPFSNVGARVSGPGVGVVSAKRGGGLKPDSGTSMATPHVAGVAALWAQKLSMTGELNGRLLADRLVGTATTAGMKPGFDPYDIGAGLVQAPQD
jgi:subtilisin family serine protease